MQMSPEVEKALASANWKEMAPRLQRYSHYWMCRKRWLGYDITLSSGVLCVDGKTVDDFIGIAVEKFARGRRKYRKELSLEVNIQGAIRSEIWNAYKKLHPGLAKKRKGSETAQDQEESWDGTVKAVPSGDGQDHDEDDFEEGWEFGQRPPSGQKLPHDPEAEETRKRQAAILEEFHASIVGDEEMEYVFMALEDDEHRPREIAKITGISAARVSEIKRKLSERGEAFAQGRPLDADLFEQEKHP